MIFLSSYSFAQDEEYSSAYPLSRDINSKADEKAFIIHPSLDYLYFSREKPDAGNTTYEIYFTNKDKFLRWKKPAIFPRSTLVGKSNLHLIGISPSNHLYFHEKTQKNESNIYVQYCKNHYCLTHLSKIKINLQSLLVRNVFVDASDSVLILSLINKKKI
jgi:hypothetical protein